MKSVVTNGRDELIRQLRPEVTGGRIENNALDTFQNSTLQPIMELQSDLVLAQFRDYLKRHKTRFHSFNRESQRDFVRELLLTDFSLRNLVVPMITGMFTMGEFTFYSSHRAQVGRRIQNLIIRKVQDRIEALY